jgi:lambda family phage portal protein
MRLWPWTKRKRIEAVGQLMLVRARFDAAQTTPDNRKHWSNADDLAADSAASAEVRRTLRNRSRYDVANNSYARGIVLTLANDVIGTGPRLQMLLGDGADAGANRTIETEFTRWAKAVGLAEKLRTMRMSRAQDGEAFLLLFSNGKLGSPVKLDVRLIEAEQVTTPNPPVTPAGFVDGIAFDEFGNPTEYHVLKQHPGDTTSISAMLAFDRIPAASMIHWFRSDRPGQHRGLPDILPALPLFAQLRRYTLAVIAAAESAANIAVLMKTNAPAGGEAAEVEPMTEMEFAPNMAVFTPEGWEPSQVKAEQPATTYEMFKREILNEIARCCNVPFNVAAGNSSGYNYSSGRLDHQTYYKSIRVEQAHIEAVVLDRIFAAWLAEAVKVFSLGDVADAPHQWFWDGHEHVDPQKEAAAQAQRLASNTTTLASEYARAGKDWETELRQRAKEIALMKELGLASAQPAPQAPAKDEPDPEDKEDDRATA